MKKITVLAGDGIGPEIMDSALEILEAASQKHFDYELTYQDFGGAAIDKHSGGPFPEKTKNACQEADAILLGAIGGPKWEKAEKTPEDGLLELRESLQLFANIRPTKVQDSLLHLSPLKRKFAEDTDFIVVRELIGGLYFGKPKYYNEEEAFDTMYYSKQSIERIVRYAFELAETRNNKLTSVDKANVLANSKLWRQVVEEVSKDYPGVEVEYLYVDAAAMKIITSPSKFDVLVTENLFGDILSDEASVISGSLGLLPSASLSEEGTHLYEPIHGSAPDIAGANKANPMSMILSVTMMLRQSFQEETLADEIEKAAYQCLENGYLTVDLGGTTTTTDFTEAVITELNQ